MVERKEVKAIGVRDHFRLGGGGGANHFCPIDHLCPKSRICLGNAFLPHMVGGGGGGVSRKVALLE